MSSRRVAIVTGASRGIGKATAGLLRERNFIVIGVSRSLSDSEASRSCDITDTGSIKKVFGGILKEFGQIDVLVNAAGIATTTAPLEIHPEEWTEVLKTNVTGTYLCNQAVLPSMIDRRYGRIVNISSIAGRSFSRSASVAYTASKYAVIGLTKQLATSFGEYGININCICPSQTKTEMLLANVSLEKQKELAAGNPLKRLAEPREVAEAICFLASEAASYINGATLDVNGGQC